MYTLRWLLPLLLASWIPTASAQDVWSYAVVGADNRPIIHFRPPIDISYPPAGVAMPMATPNQSQIARGVRLTPQEAAQRLSAPKIIIMTLPAQQAINIGRMPAPAY